MHIWWIGIENLFFKTSSSVKGHQHWVACTRQVYMHVHFILWILWYVVYILSTHCISSRIISKDSTSPVTGFNSMLKICWFSMKFIMSSSKWKFIPLAVLLKELETDSGLKLGHFFCMAYNRHSTVFSVKTMGI